MRLFTLERQFFDCGYDIRITTYNKSGEIENGLIHAQIKAVYNLNKPKYALKTKPVYSFSVSKKDYNLWSKDAFPTLLILYDAKLREAYWIDVSSLARHDPSAIKREASNVNLHVPRSNILGVQTFFALQSVKQELQLLYQNARKPNGIS